MADTIAIIEPQEPQPPPPPPPPPAQPPQGMTTVDTMPPAIPVQEPPPPEPGCWGQKSGPEKCVIILVAIIVAIALILMSLFLIYYYFYTPPEGTCLSDGCVRAASRIKDHMDDDLDPCNSFYDYSCNSWAKRQILGEGQTKLDMETKLRDDHFIKLRSLLSAGIDPDEEEFIQKPKLFYASCMNIKKLDELGTKPFMEVVESIGKFPALDPSWNISLGDYDFQTIVIELAKISVMPLFEIQVEQPFYDKTRNRLHLSDGNLYLGKKEHYMGDGDNTKLYHYQQWMVNTLVLLGADRDTAEEDAEQIVEFEIRLAKLRRDEADKENFKASYKSYDIKDIKSKYKWMDWLKLVLAITTKTGSGPDVYINEEERVDIKEPNYFENLGPLINGTSKRVMANFLLSRLLPLTAYLGSDFIKETDKYNENAFGNKPERRWKHCAISTATTYDEAVSRMFVESYFPKEAKEKVKEIVDDVMIVFRDQLVDNHWMTAKTRGEALEKLKHTKVKIGYPDFLYDDEAMTKFYEDVSANKNSLIANVVSLMKLKAVKNMNKLTKQIDTAEWTVSPTSLDGQYDVMRNEMVIPAGFLQTPIFNYELPNVVNYAGVASVVGREIIHGFDTLGKHYNASGSKKKWWTKRDEEGFKSRSACFLNQWGCYKWDGINMNGEKALGENIAYNAGLKHGFKAYRSMISRRGTEEERLPGLKMNNNQVFFISYAQMWCAAYGEEAKHDFLANSDHPPFPYRVFGTLQNSDEFSSSFGCLVGTRMNPREKCNMW